MQEHHDVAHSFLLGPARGDLARPELADARHLAKPRRVRLDHLERAEPKLPDDALGELGSYPPDHAGAEIAGHALRGGRGCGLQDVSLELQAVRPIG